MSSKFDATVEAVESSESWIGGVVVVFDDETGEYDVIPQDYLSDGSYTGPRDVVISLSPSLESATGYSLSEATAEEIAELLCNQPPAGDQRAGFFC
jgi:hypothetical protein